MLFSQAHIREINYYFCVYAYVWCMYTSDGLTVGPARKFIEIKGAHQGKIRALRDIIRITLLVARYHTSMCIYIFLILLIAFSKNDFFFISRVEW